MENPICKKVTAMLSAYIENKLNNRERLFVENHFSICPECRQKFYKMSEVLDSLHFEYEKMISEFDKIEENKTFNIKEYENFYNNISPYIDDELGYEDSLKFRKYLLKSKPARDELSKVYTLRNNIKKSTSNFMDKLNINYSRKVIKRIKDGDSTIASKAHKTAAIIIGFMLSVITAIAIFIGLNYFNQSYAEVEVKYNSPIKEIILFPDDKNWVEFFFDENGEMLLADK